MSESWQGYHLVPFKYPFRADRIRWAFMSFMDIKSKTHEGFVYLRRLRLIQTPVFGLYIHWIFTPDDDQDPHDHPWVFWTWIVRGGYTESIYPRASRDKIPPGGSLAAPSQHWPRWSFHGMPLLRAHRITRLAPNTVSLVAVGRRRHEWGFYTKDGYIDWRVYTSDGYAAFDES